jgi:hypothetical protein
MFLLVVHFMIVLLLLFELSVLTHLSLSYITPFYSNSFLFLIVFVVLPSLISLPATPFTEDQVSDLFASLDLNELVEAARDSWRADPSPTAQCHYASTLVCTHGPFEQEMGIDLLLGVMKEKE